MLPYVDISLADSVKITKTVGAGESQTKKIEMTMRVVRAINVCFLNEQMYRLLKTEKINVWVPDNLSGETMQEFTKQGLVSGINEIIALTAIQPPWQEKFEPFDTIFMTTEQLFALVELLSPSDNYQEETEDEIVPG